MDGLSMFFRCLPNEYCFNPWTMKHAEINDKFFYPAQLIYETPSLNSEVKIEHDIHSGNKHSKIFIRTNENKTWGNKGIGVHNRTNLSISQVPVLNMRFKPDGQLKADRPTQAADDTLSLLYIQWKIYLVWYENWADSSETLKTPCVEMVSARYYCV